MLYCLSFEMMLQVRQVADGNSNEMPAIPITVRQLEAVVRISESLARMQLMTQATEAHVRFAIDLFKTSTMDAVRSGIIDIAVSNLTPFSPFFDENTISHKSV